MNGSEFNWSNFFNMGGYAFFVWTSYGVALTVVVLNIIVPLLERKKIVRKVKRAIEREKLKP